MSSLSYTFSDYWKFHQLCERGHICIELSGGLDSTVLLHWCCQCLDKWPYLEVSVVHYLTTQDSASWTEVERLKVVCQSYGVSLKVIAVWHHHPGRGCVGAIRDRILSFYSFLPHQTIILTGHHHDDTSESVLLNLFRGAGLTGVSPINEALNFRHIKLCRPFLKNNKDELLHYARTHHLVWQESSSFEKIDSRVWLRQDVLSQIKSRFVDPLKKINLFASHMAEVDSILKNICVVWESSLAGDYESWIRRKWLGFSELEQKYILIQKLKSLNVLLPSTRRLCDWLAQMRKDVIKRLISWRYETVDFFITDEKIWIIKALPTPDLSMRWEYILSYKYPWPALRGHIAMLTGVAKNTPCLIKKNVFDAKELYWTYYCSGMTINWASHKTSYPIKKLMNEYKIDEWMRSRWPILCCAAEVIAIPSIGVNDLYRASDEEESGYSLLCEPLMRQGYTQSY